MREVFIQEKPESSYSGFGWGGSNDGFGWGSVWGGASGGNSVGGGSGEGAGGGATSWGDGPSDNPSSSQRAVELLRVTAGGQLMVDSNGRLIMCRQSCVPRPPLAIYLKRESDVEEEIEARHTGCIQCNLVYTQLRPLLTAPDKTLAYDLWPVDRERNKAHYQGTFPLPDPGELLTVKLMWQKGHHNINELSKMRISLFGVDSGWKTISKSSWRTVATVRVDEYRHITVNGITGKLRK